MLSNPPPVFRKRRLPARSAIVVPPVQTISVISVRRLDNIAALWTFSQPVTVLSEGSPCPQLRILSPDGWVSAVTSGNWEPNEVPCDYDFEGMAVGLAWEIVQTPAGIDFSPGVLLLPQSGVVVPFDGISRR